MVIFECAVKILRKLKNYSNNTVKNVPPNQYRKKAPYTSAKVQMRKTLAQGLRYHTLLFS